MKCPRKASAASLSFLLLSCVVVGCSTTGDPRSGGIFWSESKAKARQTEMMQTLQDKTIAAKKEEARAGALRSELASLRAQLSRAQQSREQGLASPASDPASDAEIQRLKSRINLLERKISTLNNAD